MSLVPLRSYPRVELRVGFKGYRAEFSDNTKKPTDLYFEAQNLFRLFKLWKAGEEYFVPQTFERDDDPEVATEAHKNNHRCITQAIHAVFGWEANDDKSREVVLTKMQELLEAFLRETTSGESRQKIVAFSEEMLRLLEDSKDEKVASE
jgi:hypothetical protein